MQARTAHGDHGLERRQRLAIALRHGHQVHEVARGEALGAMPQLLRHDFGRSLDQHFAPENLLPPGALRGDRAGGHEVDLAFREIQLEKARPFCIVRRQGVRPVVQPRRQMAEHLRIRNEDVDVLAEAVVVSQHQHGAATQGPPRRCRLPGERRVQQIERLPQQRLPGVYAACSHATSFLEMRSDRAMRSALLWTRGGLVHLPSSCRSPLSTEAGASSSNAAKCGRRLRGTAPLRRPRTSSFSVRDSRKLVLADMQAMRTKSGRRAREAGSIRSSSPS